MLSLSYYNTDEFKALTVNTQQILNNCFEANHDAEEDIQAWIIALGKLQAKLITEHGIKPEWP